MLDRAQKTIFYLIVFFLSSQVGLHFWPSFAYISGIRIDYLSPTLYLLDILIGLFIIINLPKVFKRTPFFKSNLLKILLGLFVLDLILNIFLVKSPAAHMFGTVKLSEFALFGFLLSRTFQKKDIRYFIDAIALSAVVSSILAIWQYINQSSVGGLWYFLGERTFNSSTIGVSTINLNGQSLRPYGAFPHPNILAFFLFMAIVFTVFRISHEEKLREKLFLTLVILISSAALLLTFSRISIFLALCFFFYAIYSKTRENLDRLGLILSIPLILVGLSIFNLLAPQFIFRGIDFRIELFVQSLFILSNNLYFGIGLNNFFIHQAPLIKEISPIIFQPPHNIFVLALVQAGLIGFWIFPAFFVFAIHSLIIKLRTTNQELAAFYKSVLFVLVSIIIVGMFDHFFLTLEQGQIILALILGLSFTKLES